MFRNLIRRSAMALMPLFGAAAGGPSGPTAPVKSPVLEGLQEAFNGESNARARYLLFAKKADQEGYGEVASLFRAAARAEEIHAASHARVIKKMGFEPKAEMASAEVKGTAENLKAAIAGETYERDTMYPEFVERARKEDNKAALRTFENALAVEAEHAKLYTMALENLESWKGEKKQFYVCPVCGNTVMDLNFAQCFVCNTPAERFEKVS